MFLFLQVLCACALAYVLSLSLAMSVTTIAGRHFHHTHHNITPVQHTSCLTTETACRFYRPAVAHQRGKHETSVAAKRARGPRNESRAPMKTAFAEQEQAEQPVNIEARLAPEKTKCDSSLSCKCKPLANGSKIAAHKSGPSTGHLKAHEDTPGLLRLSSLLFSEILSRRLVFQHPCPSTSLLNHLMTDRVHNDLVFTNFSRGMKNNNWYRGHTNAGYICVA